MSKVFLALIPLVTVLTLGGCSTGDIPGLYQLDIRQGNYVDQQMLSRLRPGMTKRQVQFVLGAPLINDPFHQDRWDYYYSLSPGGAAAKRQRVTVHFEDGRLSRVEGGINPQLVDSD
ncbi:MAG: outer membrane protein assembly factor BamE [Candidatus Competibacteraceae bacterium]|nr:outer membrane protein assembly factor BamE [Candidatus Competibacteraceae bacterium]